MSFFYGKGGKLVYAGIRYGHLSFWTKMLRLAGAERDKLAADREIWRILGLRSREGRSAAARLAMEKNGRLIRSITRLRITRMDDLLILDEACRASIKFWVTGGRSHTSPDDPLWLELIPFVFTQDEHAEAGEEIKPFPLEKEYLLQLLELMEEHPLVAIWKSRKVMATWAVAIRFLHMAQFFPAKEIIFQCKKEEESDERMVERVWQVWQHQPEELKALHPAKRMENKVVFFEPVREDGRLLKGKFGPPTGSRVLGVPQGGVQWRSGTVSGGGIDEIAHQDSSQETIRAAKAAVGGERRTHPLVLLSTPNGKEEFYRIVHDVDGDLVSEEDLSMDGQIKGSDGCSHTGMRWRMNSNGFLAVFLHYSADPSKDPCTEKGKVWFDRTRKTYKGDDGGWSREYELSASTTAGKPVYQGYWLAERNVRPLEYPKDRMPRVYRGWDFGFHRPACVWLWEHEYDLIVQGYEFMGKDLRTWQFADVVLQFSKKWFPQGTEFVDWGDPAGKQQKDSSNRTDFQILQSAPRCVSISGSHVAPRRRYETLRNICAEDEKGKVGYIVHPRCRITIEGMDGQYRYPEADPNFPDKVPETAFKDGYFDNVMDARDYAVSCGMRSPWATTKTKGKDLGGQKWNYRPTGGTRES